MQYLVYSGYICLVPSIHHKLFRFVSVSTIVQIENSDLVVLSNTLFTESIDFNLPLRQFICLRWRSDVWELLICI